MSPTPMLALRGRGLESGADGNTHGTNPNTRVRYDTATE